MATAGMCRGAATGLVLLAVAGCGGSTSTVVSTSSSPGASSSPPASTSAGEPSSSRPAPRAAAAAAAGGRCTAAMLSGALIGQQGATGHGELGFVLRNRSRRACRAFGYPGVLFLSPAGRPLPTHSVRTTHDFFGTLPLRGVRVPAGSEISFRLGVTHIATGAGACFSAAALQVIPPDDTHTLRIPVPGGAYACGRVTVSPVQPGRTAFR